MALEEKLEYQMTQEGYDKLVEELEHYKKVKRPEVIEKIKVARSFGDLSENSEYDAAKDEQRNSSRKYSYLSRIAKWSNRNL